MSGLEPTVTVDGDVSLTPTQRVVRDANAIVRVTDATGRVIGVRRMTMSVRRRVLKCISPDSAAKDRYLGLVMLAACVTEIDGAPVDALAGGGSELKFDGLIDRLDDDGFEAVGKAIQDNYAPVSGDELKNE